MPCKTHILIHILNDGASMIIISPQVIANLRANLRPYQIGDYLFNRGLVSISKTKKVYFTVNTLFKLRNFGRSLCRFCYILCNLTLTISFIIEKRHIFSIRSRSFLIGRVLKLTITEMVEILTKSREKTTKKCPSLTQF